MVEIPSPFDSICGERTKTELLLEMDDLASQLNNSDTERNDLCTKAIHDYEQSQYGVSQEQKQDWETLINLYWAGTGLAAVYKMGKVHSGIF